MRPTRVIVILGALFCTGALAQAQAVEVFVDRGEVFMRAGTSAGVEVGSNITILGDTIGGTHERRRIGVATVMEVWAALARISLDEAAKSDKAPKKFAALEGKARPAAALTPPPPPPPPVAPGPAPRAPTPPTSRAPALRGHAWFNGAGHWKLLVLYNDDPISWDRCRVQLPGNLLYDLEYLRAGDHETIALSNFRLIGEERDVPQEWVTVTCKQGAGTFVFPP